MNFVWILRFSKNRGVGWLQADNKMKKKKKKNSFKHWATGLRSKEIERSSGSFPRVREDDL